MMRIITGSAKGCRLDTLEGENTRPTAERTKEAIFSMIQFDIEGRRILDLFAGSGQMGLEALSRGAAHATFLDNAKDAVEIIKRNAKNTRLFDRCSISAGDFTTFLRNGKEKYDIVFLDPPYASGCLKPALRRIHEGGFLNPCAIVVCESGEEDIFCGAPELGRYYRVVKSARYGRSYVTLLSERGEDTDGNENE